MNHSISSASYGKSNVRLSHVSRQKDRHDFTELDISIALEGDFDAAYTEGDNRLVVPTDTMKNTVHALAAKHGVDRMEAFTQRLARHFLDAFEQVRGVRVGCIEKPWQRMQFAGNEHPHAFLGSGSEQNTCTVVAAEGSGGLQMRCGFRGLRLLKTTGSGFERFFQDELTTLPETDDRILATTVQAEWPCPRLEADWPAARQAIRDAMLDVFANIYSKSVQHTLYEMGRAALAACKAIPEISLTMPNEHHVLADLSPLGIENKGEVFVPTSEPYGLISATVSRKVTRTSADGTDERREDPSA